MKLNINVIGHNNSVSCSIKSSRNEVIVLGEEHEKHIDEAIDKIKGMCITLAKPIYIVKTGREKRRERRKLERKNK